MNRPYTHAHTRTRRHLRRQLRYTCIRHFGIVCVYACPLNILNGFCVARHCCLSHLCKLTLRHLLAKFSDRVALYPAVLRWHLSRVCWACCDGQNICSNHSNNRILLLVFVACPSVKLNWFGWFVHGILYTSHGRRDQRIQCKGTIHGIFQSDD